MHLFAGVGGGILGGMLLGHRPVCAVEIDPFCRDVLLARQADGSLPLFPIHDDINTFNANAWQGRVDIVAGGFPCQDLSAANYKAQGLAGAKSSLWFEMLRVVNECRPRFVFVENSPAIRTRGLATVLEGLAGSGYHAAWGVLSAQAVGAPHVRKRMWILAENPDACCERLEEHAQRNGATVAGEERQSRGDAVRLRADGDANGERLAVRQGERGDACEEQPSFVGTDRRLPEPGLGGASDGMAAWMDEPRRWLAGWDEGMSKVTSSRHNRTKRLRSIGNGQVPLCAAEAFRALRRRLEQT